MRGIFVANGRIADVRTLASGLEVEAGLAACSSVAQSHVQAEDADELLLIGAFLRKPPPELRVAPLEAEEILRLVQSHWWMPASRASSETRTQGGRGLITRARLRTQDRAA